jgi:hypothetical protein
MPQMQFTKDNGVSTPKKILDTGNRWARVYLQVLDASRLFFDQNRDVMMQQKIGVAPNNQQGFQILTTDKLVALWWRGELWGVSDTDGGLINYGFITTAPGDGLDPTIMGDE